MAENPLIRKVEKAEHGSMALDYEIWAHVAGDDASKLDIPPAYSVSIDRAMSLVPDARWVSVERWHNGRGKVAIFGCDQYFEAATPALALCAAALWAREPKNAVKPCPF